MTLTNTNDATAPPPATTLVTRIVAAVFFLQFLDSTIITTSLPAMARDFGVNAVAMSIGLTAYLLAMAIFIPLAGWLGDRYGARRVLIVSVAAFSIASLLCGMSANLPEFIAARILQGAAAALMAPVGRLLVLRHAPKNRLMDAISTLIWPALFAPIIGPVLGAWITQTVGWHWNFFLNIPIGVGCVVLLVLLVPNQDTVMRRRFDGVGFVLSGMGLLLLLGGMELFVGQHGPLLALGLIGSGCALCGLAWRHMRRTTDPLLDLEVLSVPTFRLAAMTVGTLGRIAINATPFLLPLMFQLGFGMTAVQSGGLILVYFAGNLAMKTLTTPVMRRFGFRRVLLWNGLLSAISVAAFAGVSIATPTPILWALLFFAGLTRSLQFTALNTLAFADISVAQRSTSTTLSAMTQQVSQLMAVALSVALIRAAQMLRGAAGSEAVAGDLTAAFAGIAMLGLISALAFLRLAETAGQDVSGHVDADAP